MRIKKYVQYLLFLFLFLTTSTTLLSQRVIKYNIELGLKIRPNPFNEKSRKELGLNYFKGYEYYRIKNDYLANFKIQFHLQIGNSVFNIGSYVNVIDLTYNYKHFYFITQELGDLETGFVTNQRLLTLPSGGLSVGYSYRYLKFELGVSMFLDMFHFTTPNSRTLRRLIGYQIQHGLRNEDFTKLSDFIFINNSSKFGMHNDFYCDIYLKYHFANRFIIGLGMNFLNKNNNIIWTKVIAKSYSANPSYPFDKNNYTYLNNTIDTMRINGFFVMFSYEIFR